jgi:hypothetical protein
MTTTAPFPKPPPASSTRDLLLGGSLVVGVLLGGAFVLFYVNYRCWVGPLWDADEHSPDCLPTTAMVTGGDKTTGRGTSYSLNYTYEVEGKTIEAYQKVASHIYDGSNIGETINICYMKDHPTWSAIRGNDAGEYDILAICLDFFVLSGLVKLIRNARKKRKESAAPR